MKQVRVIKDFYFGKPGDILYVDSFGVEVTSSLTIDSKIVEKMVKEGYLEYFEEKKDLETMLNDVNFLKEGARGLVVSLARKRALEIYDKWEQAALADLIRADIIRIGLRDRLEKM